MVGLNQIWENVLTEIETKVTTLVYDLYVKTLQPVGIYKDRIVVLAETAALKNIVNNKYLDVLTKATQAVFPSIAAVDVITEDDVPNLAAVQKEVDIAVSDKFVEEKPEETSFYPDYTFENFITGKSNEYAKAVSMAVAENPGKKYNPLFIWGGVGLGKTHLMHAIGNYISRNDPQKKTLYVTCDTFTNELIEALRDKKTDDAKKRFRKKYRSADVLMVDDIQFLAGREGTQEEFFNTFSELYLGDKQIIICSDRPPKDINIADRLRSRFSTGIIANINPPDFETRVAILRNKCAEKKQTVSIDIINLIAQNVTTNVREMEGVLNRIVSYASLVGGDLNDVNLAYESMRDYTDDRKEMLTMDQISDAVCEYYRVTREDLIGKKRKKEIVIPRQVCIYLISEMMSVPLVSIGEYFGGRDHTTMIHARDKISEELKNNGMIAIQVKDVKNKLFNK